MDKLKVFSEKMQQSITFTLSPSGRLVTPDGLTQEVNHVFCAWNNSSDGWVDSGWNNSSDRWVDSGWNNSSDRWVDSGWNNSSDRWSDSGWSNSSDSWGDSGGGSSGCYLTSACVNYKGLKDDCHELEVLRQYRDRLVQEDKEFRLKVLEYYRKAPLIVQHVEASQEKGIIWNSLYDNMIVPCVNLLENGRTEEAKQLYLDSYEDLASRYLQ